MLPKCPTISFFLIIFFSREDNFISYIWCFHFQTYLNDSGILFRFEEAAKRMGVDAVNCLVVEDSL